MQTYQLRCLESYRQRMIICVSLFYRKYVSESQVPELGLFLLINGMTDEAESDY